MSDLSLGDLKPGQLLARGVGRLLQGHGFVSVEEFVPAAGLRVDVMGLGPKSEIWVVECKSSRVDFTSDAKWQGYLNWCDRYFWAVPAGFDLSPLERPDFLPERAGVIVADRYDAAIVREARTVPLASATRRKCTLAFARRAARRVITLTDPDADGLGWSG